MLVLIKKTGKWLGGLLLGFALVYLSINAADEELNPELVAILKSKPTVAPKDNAFFYVMGIDAPPEKNPIEVGRVYSQRLRQAERELPVEEAMKVAAAAKGASTLTFVGQVPKCDWRREDCLEVFGAQAIEIKKLARENATLMMRYAELVNFHHFDDRDTSVLLFRPNEAIQAPRLDQGLAAVAFREGRRQEFLQRVGAQSRFARVQLRGNNLLITKMLGVAYLEQVTQLVSTAVRAGGTLRHSEAVALLEAVTPMNAEERRLKGVLDGETRFAFDMLGQEVWAMPYGGIWEKLLYQLTLKRNATQNQMFSLNREWLTADAVPAYSYLAVEQQVLERLRQGTPQMISLDMIYNPAGKVMAAIGSHDMWASYFRRVIDADGLLRLVSLQVQIAAQGVQEADIPAFLAKADPKYHDPYTGKPMQWSKERGLHFRGYSDRLPDPDGWVSVRL